MKTEKPPATVQRDAARANRHKFIQQNLLLARALSFHYPSHLAPTSGKAILGAWVLCVHVPAGPVTWRLLPGEEGSFDHLERVEGHSWDRATQQDKLDRLAAITRDDL